MVSSRGDASGLPPDLVRSSRPGEVKRGESEAMFKTSIRSSKEHGSKSILDKAEFFPRPSRSPPPPPPPQTRTPHRHISVRHAPLGSSSPSPRALLLALFLFVLSCRVVVHLHSTHLARSRSLTPRPARATPGHRASTSGGVRRGGSMRGGTFGGGGGGGRLDEAVEEFKSRS